MKLNGFVRALAHAASWATFAGTVALGPAALAAGTAGGTAAAPAARTASAASPLWPDAPIVGQRLPEGVEVRAQAGGPVIVDHLLGVEIHGDYAYLYRKAANATDDSDYVKGVMTRAGRILIPIEYAGVSFYPACACFEVERDHKIGLLDAQGQVRAALVYDRVHEGFRDDETLWEVEIGPRVGVLDARTGALVLPVEFARVAVEQTMILAKASAPAGKDEEDDADDTEPRWHAFDRGGRPIAGISAAKSLTYWDQARAVVVDGEAVYDAQGRALISAGKYFSIRPEGARAIVGKGRSSYGLVDVLGKEVVPPRYDGIWALSTHDGRQRFGIRVDGLKGERYGMIDADGKLLITPTMTSLREGSAADNEHRKSDDEPAPRHDYLQVYQGDRVGLYDFDGKQWLAPIYDSLSTDDYDTPWMLVRKGKQSGLYNLIEHKFTIAVGKYQALVPLHGVGRDDELFSAQVNGRTGVVDRNGKVVVPFDYDTLVVSDREPPTLAGSRARKLNGIALEGSDDGQWRIKNDKLPVYVEKRYDNHPLAALMSARIEARYVPEGYDSAERITAAFAAGKLDDANAPSILLSEETAYVGFSNIRLSRARPMLPLAMPVCRDDQGFRLLTTEPQATRAGHASAACDDENAAALHFTGDPEGQLVCEDCARLGYPRIWLRQDAGPSCGLPDWRADAAGAQLQAWQTQFRAAWQALPAAAAGISAQQLVDDTQRAMEASLEPKSRASLALAASRVGESQWDGLVPRGAHIERQQLTNAVIEALLRAVPAGQGGRYPEQSAQLPQCSRVWYLKIADIEAAVRAYEGQLPLAWANSFRVPAGGSLARNAYPFATFTESSDGRLRLAGISRELVEAVAWYLSSRSAAQ